MSEVEQGYDKFMNWLKQLSSKVDSDLLVTTMYLERKFPNVEPKVDLDIHFKPGINVQEKRHQIHEKFGLQTASHGKNALLTSGRMTASTIMHLASSDQIVNVTGNATAASY
ncbi:MAG: hypothetical protein QF657_03495 [Candidatus Nitrosopelagicus sp.]|jgi:hypothetical protein|nr:hypothetical protein [Candidatus Nitrosopelagicus sp.]MDP6899096.1 hypothetical protein [Candidatus Nitrosopelagicus sp.]|tara:strand:+ start:1320 stop:1655 length:336 start_codon:yes stop_codon:yes gene_type:complete